MAESMLTTIDNPFNPFTQYEDWFAYDTRVGHNTAQFLARIVISSDELSDEDQSVAIEHAIDEIVKENVSGLYRKVTQTESE
jgi:hypothetical protein